MFDTKPKEIIMHQDQIELLKRILSYVLDMEKQHFEESEEPAEHIYALAFKALNELEGTCD